MDEKTQKLRAAIAEFMEIPPESVGDFILGFEKVVDGGMEFSSLWTTDLYWRLKGFLNEIDLHVDSVRQQNLMQKMAAQSLRPDESSLVEQIMHGVKP